MNFPAANILSQLTPQQQQVFQLLAANLAKQQQQPGQQGQAGGAPGLPNPAALLAALAQQANKGGAANPAHALVAAAAAAAAGKPGGAPSGLGGLQQPLAAMLAQAAARPQGVLPGVVPSLLNPAAVTAAAAAEAAKSGAAAKAGKKRKPQDRSLTDKVPLVVPESEAFNDLLTCQRTVDDLIQRKQHEIKEALSLPERTHKLLRLYVLNTHSHQAHAKAGAKQRGTAEDGAAAGSGAAGGSGTTAPTDAGAGARPGAGSGVGREPASWTLYVGGRVMDREPQQQPGAGAGAGGQGSAPGAGPSGAGAGGVGVGGGLPGMPGPGGDPALAGATAAALPNPFGPPAAAPLPNPFGPPGTANPGFPGAGAAAGQLPGAAAAGPGQAGGAAGSNVPGAQPGANGTAPGQAAGVSGGHGPPHGKQPPAMSFVRRLEIRLDPEVYPKDNVVVWDKAQHVGPYPERFEFKRLGDKSCDVTVSVDIDWQPERFMLDARLAAVLGLQYESKPRILRALWQYIRRLRPQDPSQPHSLHLPMELAQVLGTSSVQLSQLSEVLAPHLSPMQPLQITHTIKLDGPSPSFSHCHDVEVAMPPTLSTDPAEPWMEKVSVDSQVDALDAQLLALVQRINEHRRRRDFLLGFAHSPTDFINGLVASQARDMRIGKGATDYEVERRSDLFRQPWAQEAAVHFLHKKMRTRGPG